MKQIRFGIERRRFLRLCPLVATTIVLATGTGKSFAQAAQPQVGEQEAKAENLGYKLDATAVDQQKFPKYQPGQMCANCQFYKGTSGEAFGPCQIFSGKQVSARGWCVSYWKKV